MGFHHGTSDRNATAAFVRGCKYGTIDFLEARGGVDTSSALTLMMISRFIQSFHLRFFQNYMCMSN